MTTMNSFQKDSYDIPFYLKSSFRIVSLVEPDVEQILRARCIRYGIRGPNILASRLKNLYELFHGTFSDPIVSSVNKKSQLTIASLLSAIKTIYLRQHGANSGNEDNADSRTTSSVANHSANKYGTSKNESMKV